MQGQRSLRLRARYMWGGNRMWWRTSTSSSNAWAATTLTLWAPWMKASWQGPCSNWWTRSRTQTQGRRWCCADDSPQDKAVEWSCPGVDPPFQQVHLPGQDHGRRHWKGIQAVLGPRCWGVLRGRRAPQRTWPTPPGHCITANHAAIRGLLLSASPPPTPKPTALLRATNYFKEKFWLVTKYL